MIIYSLYKLHVFTWISERAYNERPTMKKIALYCKKKLKNYEQKTIKNYVFRYRNIYLQNELLYIFS